MANRFDKYTDSMKPLFEFVGRMTMTQRIIIVVIVFSLLISGFVFFSYMPKFKEIGRLEKEYEKVASELKVAKDKASQLDALKKEWGAKQDEFEAVMAALPDKKEIPSLLDEISKAGNEAGLEFKRFAPQPEAIREFYAEIPVAVDVIGNYYSITLFFENIADMSRIVNVRNIRIRPNEQDKNYLLGSFTVVTYRFLQPEEMKQGKKKKKKR